MRLSICHRMPQVQDGESTEKPHKIRENGRSQRACGRRGRWFWFFLYYFLYIDIYIFICHICHKYKNKIRTMPQKCRIYKEFPLFRDHFESAILWQICGRWNKGLKRQAGNVGHRLRWSPLWKSQRGQGQGRPAFLMLQNKEDLYEPARTLHD